MFFVTDTARLKRLRLTNAPTVRELIITTGRKLQPPPRIEASAKAPARPATNYKNMNPAWILTTGIGD